MGMPTQPLMKPNDASVTGDGCCFSTPALCALPAPPSECRTAVPASASAGHHACRCCGSICMCTFLAPTECDVPPVVWQSKAALM